MKKFLFVLLATTLTTSALAAQQPVAQLSSVTASREALRTAVNTQLAAVQANFDEIYPILTAGPVYVNTTAPADTKVVWVDTDQDNAIKVYIGGAWTVVGSGGIAGDNLGGAAYSDVVDLWTTCTGYLKSDGTCDTPSGSAEDVAYDITTWDADTDAPSKNVVRDYLVNFDADGDGDFTDETWFPSTSGAPTNAGYLTTQSEAGLSAEANLGLLTTGLLKITVADSVATPSTAAAGTDYQTPLADGTTTGDILEWNDSTETWTPSTPVTITGDSSTITVTNGVFSVTSGVFQPLDTDLTTAASGGIAGNSKYFGTNASGTVGYYDLPSGGGYTDRQKEIGWVIADSDADTVVADGKQAIVIPASMNGMNLVDVTCSVHDLNSAASGATTVVLRRVRGGTAADMTSTGVTIDYDAYTASDETVDTSNDDVATGDKIYADVDAVTTAAQKGLSCTAVLQLP